MPSFYPQNVPSMVSIIGFKLIEAINNNPLASPPLRFYKGTTVFISDSFRKSGVWFPGSLNSCGRLEITSGSEPDSIERSICIRWCEIHKEMKICSMENQPRNFKFVLRGAAQLIAQARLCGLQEFLEAFLSLNHVSTLTPSRQSHLRRWESESKNSDFKT
ncbi:hypothetical protein ACFX13_035558 [Malus domestica]